MEIGRRAAALSAAIPSGAGQKPLRSTRRGRQLACGR
jgi:hypothetical protein